MNRSCTDTSSEKIQTYLVSNHFIFSSSGISIIEIEQLHLWARWLELQRERAVAVTEPEAVEERRKHTGRRRQQRRREIWAKQWLTRRPLYGQYEQTAAGAKQRGPQWIQKLPQSERSYVYRISPGIEKRETNFREALEHGLKLAVTLRHLATGASYADFMYSFRVGKNTISIFVPKVLEAIIQEYSAEVLPDVVTTEQWQKIPSETSLVPMRLLMANI